MHTTMPGMIVCLGWLQTVILSIDHGFLSSWDYRREPSCQAPHLFRFALLSTYAALKSIAFVKIESKMYRVKGISPHVSPHLCPPQKLLLVN
jgi:hypothetical protein